MKVSNLVGLRFKERPADCVVESHALMVRGGYIKYVGSGIYSELPTMRRITKKIERIINSELDSIGSQEVLFPFVLPADLWEESGRYESVGNELLRIQDRNKAKLVLGMTHEEAAVQLVREYGQSYTRYPFTVHQMQRKFRDEARPRAGMIRVREFTMSDAYSFHTNQKDLEKTYDDFFKAYTRIFQKAGVPEVVTVASDSGMMGGSLSHEYMLLADAGEDSIVICPECGYRANMEAAENKVENVSKNEIKELELIETPDCKTIEAVNQFLTSSIENSCKAVVYQRADDDSYVVAFVRGDYEVNETKLTNLLGTEIRPAEITEDAPLVAGYIGPKGISSDVTVYIDLSLKGIDGFVCGANKEGFHYRNFNITRDLGDVEFVDIAKVKEGSICPCCGKKRIIIKRGIEVGNIFQLGDKYTVSMNMQYLDENGEQQYPIMGCYGIGVGRLAASICEARHDEFGPIWPITVAPWEVEVCCLRVDDEQTKEEADKLYHQLQKEGVEVLYDDPDVRPGSMFSDADLLAAPIRVIVSPRGLKDGVIEVVTRDKSVEENVAVDNAMDYIKNLRKKLYDDIYAKVE